MKKEYEFLDPIKNPCAKKPKKQIINNLSQALADRVVFAMVYGSILKPSFNQKSDVDVALYLNHNEDTPENLFNFQAELSEATGRDVDLVFLNRADLIITMQILTNGQLIVENDHRQFIEFKALKISQYIDFKMSRKIIEDNMLKGRIYA